MKFYELTRTDGRTAGLFRTKQACEAAYIDNFLNGGSELIETETEIKPDKNGFVYLWAGYCYLHTRTTNETNLNVKWSDRKDKALTPYFRSEAEAHEALKPYLPKSCEDASTSVVSWYTDNTPERLTDYCTQMHLFSNGK